MVKVKDDMKERKAEGGQKKRISMEGMKREGVKEGGKR